MGLIGPIFRRGKREDLGWESVTLRPHLRKLSEETEQAGIKREWFLTKKELARLPHLSETFVCLSRIYLSISTQEAASINHSISAFFNSAYFD